MLFEADLREPHLTSKPYKFQLLMPLLQNDTVLGYVIITMEHCKHVI